MRNSKRGFSLMEILITLALFSILLSLGLFMSLDAFRGTLYHIEEATIMSVLGRARNRAMNNISQSPWGVCYVAPNYIVFKGTSCSLSAAYETMPVNPVVAADSDFAGFFPTVVFTQLSGTTTPVTFTVQQGSRSTVITINYEGAIIW